MLVKILSLIGVGIRGVWGLIGPMVLAFISEKIVGWWKRFFKRKQTDSHIEGTEKEIKKVVDEAQKKIDAGELTPEEREEIRRKKVKLEEDIFNGTGDH